MESNQTKNPLNGWISSLAISVVCCAVLFVVFAGYLIEIKDNENVTHIRLEILEQRMSSVANQIDNLYHRPNVQQIQLMPGNTQAPTVAITPASQATDSAVPTPAPQPPAMPAMAPAATTAPATAAPAEIPAK